MTARRGGSTLKSTTTRPGQAKRATGTVQLILATPLAVHAKPRASRRVLRGTQ